MKTIVVLLICLFSLPFSIEKNEFEYEAECEGSGVNGTHLIKIWVYCKKPKQAKDLAKKCAIEAVLFKGIGTGKSGGCAKDPIIRNKEIIDKNKSYFDEFFKDNGPYLQYVSWSGDGSIDPLDVIHVSNKKQKIGMVVVVNFSDLKVRLQNDKIIKKFGDGL